MISRSQGAIDRAPGVPTGPLGAASEPGSAGSSEVEGSEHSPWPHSLEVLGFTRIIRTSTMIPLGFTRISTRILIGFTRISTRILIGFTRILTRI